MISLIPSWVSWLAIGVLAAAVGGQEVRVQHLKTDVATLEKAQATDRANRALVAQQHAELVVEVQAAHAAAIMENDNAWKTKLDAAESRVAERGRTIAGLRGDIAAFIAAGGRQTGDTDATALARATDRLATLGAMVERSNDLLQRAEAIIVQRDIEVSGLLAVIHADRAACTSGPTPAGRAPSPS